MSKTTTRRQFLIITAALGAGAAGLYSTVISRKKSYPPRGTIIGGGRGRQAGIDLKYLAIMNLDISNPAPFYLPLAFQPHGIAVHPGNPNLIAVFEKKGPGACEIDLQKRKVVRDIETLKGRHFYGHGVYSLDGSRLYCTETVLETQEGLIAIRDSMSLQLHGEFPTFGANPHECQLVENGKVLAITNGGGTQASQLVPSVTYVDIDSQKLISKHEMNDRRFNTGHMGISTDKKLVVISAPRDGLPEEELGAISMLDASGALDPLTSPPSIINRQISETLSICIDEKRQVFAATSPKGNLVTFWNLKTKELLSSLEIPSPRGIVLTKNNNYYAISHDVDASLIFVDANTLHPDVDSRIAKAGFSGSHLYIL